MNITVNDLREMNACSAAIQWVEQQNTTDLYELFDLVKQSGLLNWANWYVSKILNQEQKIWYAIYAAESLLHLYEEEYRDDNRPRKAIEAAKNYLNNPKEYSASHVSAAAFDAVDAADTACTNDSSSAAFVAVYAAHAAADLSDSDADIAVNDYAPIAASKELMINIIEYGLSLLVD